MGYLQNKIQQRAELPRISLLDGDLANHTRKLIIEEALTWVDTPFRHQGRLKGVGADCIGAIIGIARAFKYDKRVNFSDITNYGRTPDAKFMRENLAKYLDPISREEALPADILHFWFLQEPQHVALLLHNHYILHADETVITSAKTKGKIVVHRLDKWWWSRVVAAYRFRELEKWLD